ncbi:hypothetical protein FRB95_003764 [Tulasnella sp. JGI-2019a]|nr:hypothetical protein FRB95_003764 [Tulasnella sp. JGI-2019a]
MHLMSFPFASSSTLSRHVFRFNAPRLQARRKSTRPHSRGPTLPAISTLVEETHPSEERFLTFHTYFDATSGALKDVKVERRVVKDNVGFGVAELYLGRSVWSEHQQTSAGAAGEPLRLCPWYDPDSKTLRFRHPDGADSAQVKPLAELIARKGCKPLLELAHVEDLIERVPATELISLDFNTILDSGYHVRAGLTIGLRATHYQANIRFRGERNTRQVSWTPMGDDKIDQKDINCFPYIDPQDDRLRIWDVDAKRNLEIMVNQGSLNGLATKGMADSKRGRASMDSFSADDVKRRWPMMHAMIQNMGYWMST